MYVFYKAVCMKVLIQGTILAFLHCLYAWKREVLNLVAYGLDEAMSFGIFVLLFCTICSSFCCSTLLGIPDVHQEWFCCQSPCKTAELGNNS